MKNISIGFTVGVIVMAFLYKSCDDKKYQTITIPESVSDFETKTDISHTPINGIKTIEVPKWYKDTKTEKELKQQLSEQEKRLKLYEEEMAHTVDYFQFQDSLTKAKLYAECNKLNSFSETWEDSLSLLTINGIVQGKVKEITPYLLIKERRVNLPLKNNNLFLNLNASTHGEPQTIMIGAGLRYKNYSVIYNRLNNQNFYGVGYDIKIF